MKKLINEQQIIAINQCTCMLTELASKNDDADDDADNAEINTN